VTEHDTSVPDRPARAKQILDTVNAEFPGHQLGWNSGRPWLRLADELVAKDAELATYKRALVETVQAQQPAGRLRELLEENQRLTRELDAALGSDARARQECNELYELVSLLNRDVANAQQAYKRTFDRLVDIETEEPAGQEGGA
jgi:hypothetical protein